MPNRMRWVIRWINPNSEPLYWCGGTEEWGPFARAVIFDDRLQAQLRCRTINAGFRKRGNHVWSCFVTKAARRFESDG